jgi:hypothetical protein
MADAPIDDLADRAVSVDSYSLNTIHAAHSWETLRVPMRVCNINAAGVPR